MTATDRRPAQTSFHEATLTAITHIGAIAKLTLEDVFIAGVVIAAEVEIEGVTQVLRDGEPIEDLKMEKEDGEILTLCREGDQIVLVVEWNDFAALSQETVIYTFMGP